MSKRLTNFIREIDSIAPKKKEDGLRLLLTRGENAYASVMKLMELIEETVPPDQSADLTKRFFNAVKTGKFRKFQLGIEKAIKAEKEKRDVQNADGVSEGRGRKDTVRRGEEED